MQVTFRTTRLRKCYMEAAAATREWGAAVGRRYIERINVLKVARSIDDLHAMAALRFHPLKGTLAGRYAMTLVDRWRLIVSFEDDALTIVRIEEVSAHYGD